MIIFDKKIDNNNDNNKFDKRLHVYHYTIKLPYDI